MLRADVGQEHVDWSGAWEDLRRELTASAVLGVFLGALGPFGTYVNGGLAERLAYWVASVVVATLIYGFGVRFAVKVGSRYHQPVWFLLPVAVCFISLPYSVVLAIVAVRLWPIVARSMNGADWYGQCVLMALPMSILAVWVRSLNTANWAAISKPPSAVVTAATHWTLERPLQKLAPDLLCLQVEDHYVRVYTTTGSSLLLIALKDAIAELEAVDGLQVHRSWWVAKVAVSEAVTNGRNRALRLTNGLEVPISRSAALILRDAGWL